MRVCRFVMRKEYVWDSYLYINLFCTLLARFTQRKMITLPGIDQTLIFRYPVPYGSEPCLWWWSNRCALSISLSSFSLSLLSLNFMRHPLGWWDILLDHEREREREGLPCTIPSLTHQGYKSSYAIIGCNWVIT